MTELLIYAAALLVLFLSAQAGARSGAFAALSWMLNSVFAFLITMRYWFLLTHAASAYETASLPILATFCFWLPFVLILFVLVKLRENYISEFEAVSASFVGRLLGALFGTVSGAVFAAALVMTFSLLAPDYFPAGQPTHLPVPLDAMPPMAFRYLETNLAGVNEKNPAHTPLPRARNTAPNPVVFWQ